MKRELSTFQKIAEAALVVIAVVVEFVLTYTTLYLNAWPAIQRGYWLIVWAPITAWVFMTLLLWVSVALILVKRRALKRSLRSANW